MARWAAAGIVEAERGVRKLRGYKSMPALVRALRQHACPDRAKVAEPRWCSLSKTVSYILANSQLSGGTEALLSFWGEPFMARTTGQDVPRFIFHVQSNSEILPHLVELQRTIASSHHE